MSQREQVNELDQSYWSNVKRQFKKKNIKLVLRIKCLWRTQVIDIHKHSPSSKRTLNSPLNR